MEDIFAALELSLSSSGMSSSMKLKMTCRSCPERCDRHKVGAFHLSPTHHALLVVFSSAGYFGDFGDFQLKERGQRLTTDTA